MEEKTTLNKDSETYKIYLNGKLFIDDDPETLLQGYEFEKDDEQQEKKFSNFEQPKN